MPGGGVLLGGGVVVLPGGIVGEEPLSRVFTLPLTNVSAAEPYSLA